MNEIRTYFNWGKKPLNPTKLKSNGIYAVRHSIPVETAQEWGVDRLMQWGIIVLDASRDIRRCWNLTKHNAWDDVRIWKFDNINIYPATEIEMQFAKAAEGEEVYSRRYCTEKQRLLIIVNRLSQAEQQLSYINKNIWHRIAKAFDKFF